jgi:predicted dehydrogenase
MTRVDLGLIGLGKWVREPYLPILREMHEVRVVAAAARTEASRDLARVQFGPGVRLYPEYRELLADPGVQAVAIALPNALHAAAVEAAATAGKHVFFEPPLGLDGSEIRRTLQTLTRTDRVVQADLELRCLPVMDVARSHLDAGTIGDPLMTRVRLWCDWGHGGGPWLEEVGGQSFFLWLGCWYFDLLDWLYQAPAVRASVAGGYAMNGRLMDHGLATLEFPDRRIGCFEFNLVAVEGARIDLSIAGTRGEIEADLVTGLCRWRLRKEPWRETRAPGSEPVHGFAGMRESITDFVHAVRTGSRPRADVAACGRVHAAALACARAELERTTVTVEPLGAL